MRVIFKAEKICYSVLMHYTVLSSVKAMQRMIEKTQKTKKLWPNKQDIFFMLVEIPQAKSFPNS